VTKLVTPERWLPYPGWEGYYLASSESRVYSLPRRQSDGRVRAGAMMTPSPDSGGYLCVTLSCGGKSVTKRVHDIVAETFIGPKPAGKQVRHLNGNQRVNRRKNLRYGSQSQNERDKRTRSGRLERKKREVSDVTGVSAYRVSLVDTSPEGLPWAS
jgi:HNH endonuclease/NUMOD4 motif